MKKLFICLANSKKYGERCVAGIEVEKRQKGGFNVVRDEGGKPIWIRPITESMHGAVPKSLVKDMGLFDVYEIEIKEECPNGYQSENVKFKKKSLKKVSSVKISNKNLKRIIETERDTLFTNRGKAIHSDVINTVDHSLVLIKGQNANVYKGTEHNEKQVRIKFTYQNTEYDLPITDIVFLSKYEKDNNIVSNENSVYISISVGVEHNGWYNKLAAGIICV